MIFLNSARFAALPAIWQFKREVLVHTLTPRENRERPESGIFFKVFEKNTIFNEHPVVDSVLA